MSLLNILKNRISESEYIHISPNIPNKKASSAIKSYANDIKTEDIFYYVMKLFLKVPKMVLS